MKSSTEPMEHPMSRNKQRGTAWETAICRFLAAEGFPHVERRALSGGQDRGDIAGIPGVVIEAKNAQRTELGAWVDEALLEQANEGAEFSAVWHHRRGRAGAGDGYVTMTGETFARLLRTAGYGEPLSGPQGDRNPSPRGPVTPAAQDGPQRPPAADAWNQVDQL
jgi:hypothetical protein